MKSNVFLISSNAEMIFLPLHFEIKLERTLAAAVEVDFFNKFKLIIM